MTQSINELKSYTEYNVSTPTSVFTIGFQYEYNVDHVNVYVNGVEATAAGYTIAHDSHGTISLTPAVPSGIVRVSRETDIDTSAHTFSAGAKFTAGNMGENFQQIRHAQQEVRDGFSKLSTDTYEIIDTLQDVGQAAQDAADAAEQAAQTANDAAAQVNDKVSYQDLDDAVDLAVAPIRDYTTLPYEVGKSYALNARVMLGNGDIVKSIVAGNTVDPNVDMTGWLNPKSRTYYIEEFGASPSKTAVQNSAAIQAAFLALSNGDKLYQASSLIEIDSTDCTLVNAINNVTIKLNLKYAGAGASSLSAVFVNKLHDSLIDISVDGNNKNLHLLQCNECRGSVIPSNTILKNSYGTQSLVAGVFTRDSDDMQILCKVRNINTDGTQAVRGVMISDQTITKNTSYIAPQIENVTCPIGSAVVDADGVYAEHSNADHTGGIRIQNGSYKNCSKRFIKVTMPNPIITGNIGRNDNAAETMYSFVSTYKDDAGLISDNDFQTSGSVGYGVDIGISTSTTKATIGKNKLIASIVTNNSYAYRINGPINNMNITVGETVGFSGLFSQVNASTAGNQVLSLKTGSFNNLQSSDLRNCITISGDFRLFNVDDIECANSVASRFFISAANISDNIANVTNIRHSYSFGSWGGTTTSRPKNLQDHTANRYVDGKLFAKLATTPASGTYRAGDIIEYTNPASWVGAVYDGSGWKNYGFINKQSVTTYDPPIITAGTIAETDVTLQGVDVGNLVQAVFNKYNANIRVSATVRASNTIRVFFENVGTTDIDLESGSIIVKTV